MKYSGHQSETMRWHMGLKICMGDKTHRYYKHTKFHQNLRGDPKFLFDLTWDDPYASEQNIWCLYHKMKIFCSNMLFFVTILK